MLIIDAEVKESWSHGLGLFTRVDLRKGDVVVKPSSPGLDIELTEEQFAKLDEREKQFILHYGFINKRTGLYHLTFDNTRYINHAIEPNMVLDPNTEFLVAKRDIKAGEELTQDYSDFENLRANLQGVI